MVYSRELLGSNTNVYSVSSSPFADWKVKPINCSCFRAAYVDCALIVDRCCQARRGRRGVSLGTARASPLDRLRSSSFAPPQGGSGCGGAFGALGTRIGEHQGSCAGAAPLAPKRGGATGASRPLVQGAFGPGIVVYLIGPLGPPLERRTEISSQSTPLLGSRAFAAPELLFSTHLLSLSLCVPTALTYLGSMH